ncbi:MAG: family 16 glycoside hydrolase [Candidatus Bathyarchaeia archaeon]
MENKWSHKLLAVLVIFLLSAPVLMVNFENANAISDVSFSDDFTDGTADSWTEQVGSWKVTNAQYCVSVGIVENGISTVNGMRLADCVIETQVKFTDSVGFRAGIVFRYIDDKHYYSFELSNEYDCLDIIKYTPQDPNYGDNTKLAQLKPFPIQSDKVYQLKVVVKGNLFHCYVDGKEVLNGTDNEYTYGTVGLRARRADACFDNFKVYDATQAPSPTPTPTASLQPYTDLPLGTYTDDFSKDIGY